jgi:ketosteroid isomerase-like protein
MKTLTTRPNLIILYLISLITIPTLCQAQSVTDEIKAMVLTEIQEQHRLEQKAFIEGDCETVISFYDDDATIYRMGRLVDTLELLEFCRKIPRPFSGGGTTSEINDNFFVLSENAVHFVRTIDIEPADDDPSSFKREVITKVWFKSAKGWKIVHFHSSIHPVRVQAM